MVNILSREQQDLLNSIKDLQNILSSATLTSSEMAQLEFMTKKQKEKLVSEIYFKGKKRKEFYTTKDGRWKSYNPQFISPTLDGLIEKLYNYYFSSNLEEVFKKWVFHRQEMDIVSNKTIEEDVGLWKRTIANTEIAQKPIAEIEQKDLWNLFLKWTGNGKITRKDFNNRKSILNGVFRYAVFEEIIKSNPLTDLPCNELKFDCKPPKNKVYTIEERDKLLAYLETLEQDAYTLAIQLSFYSILRIGEIKGLRWEESDYNKIYIEKQLTTERTMNEDMTFNSKQVVEKAPKGNPYFSIREESINEKGLQVLYKMKQLNPNGKYLFMYQDRPLTTDTFNRRLQKYCKEIGIEYHSSHGIRFTSASICHANGMQDTEIQPLLGHSTLRMTQHYLRSVSKQNSLQMQNVLC